MMSYIIHTIMSLQTGQFHMHMLTPHILVEVLMFIALIKCDACMQTVNIELHTYICRCITTKLYLHYIECLQIISCKHSLIVTV